MTVLTFQGQGPVKDIPALWASLLTDSATSLTPGLSLCLYTNNPQTHLSTQESHPLTRVFHLNLHCRISRHLKLSQE